MLKFMDTSKAFSRGLWLNTGSVTAAEIAAEAGFDWLLVDCEHGLNDENTLREILRAVAQKCAVLVRIPDHASPLLERSLDFGAAGIVAPGVSSAAQAATLTARMAYPPKGNRSVASSCRAAAFGRNAKEYLTTANQQLVLICQIEDARGVAQAGEIAAVDGVAGLFLGHSDLSMNLGVFGQWDCPQVKNAETAVLEACRIYGKMPGMLMKSGRDVAHYLAEGFRMIGLGSDSGILKSGCDKLLK